MPEEPQSSSFEELDAKLKAAPVVNVLRAGREDPEVIPGLKVV